MVGKCANSCCRVDQNENEGKLFRLDIEVGSTEGSAESRTEYVWLCDCCAQILRPMVEVADKAVRLRLVRKPPGSSSSHIPCAQAN
jgi:hypothetical protein